MMSFEEIKKAVELLSTLSMDSTIMITRGRDGEVSTAVLSKRFLDGDDEQYYIYIDEEQEWGTNGESLDELKVGILYDITSGVISNIDVLNSIDVSEDLMIKVAFANTIVDNLYGNIYKQLAHARYENPGENLMIGYIVVNKSTGLCPDMSRDWYFTVDEAKEHIDKNFQ